jgi:hypothetical protein
MAPYYTIPSGEVNGKSAHSAAGAKLLSGKFSFLDSRFRRDYNPDMQYL